MERAWKATWNVMQRRSLIYQSATLIFVLLLSVPAGAELQSRAPTEIDIAAGITLPKTPERLLRNLKFAWDRALLVQSSFYTDANLLKFFNGAEVKWDQESGLGDPPDIHKAVVTVDAQSFPMMQVEIIRGVLRKAQTDKTAALSGLIIIHVESVRGLSVGLVREIFGKESRDELDFGMSTDGHAHDPTTAGSVVYDNREKEGMAVPFQDYQATFGVKKTRPGMPIQGSTFHDNEQIETIAILQAER